MNAALLALLLVPPAPPPAPPAPPSVGGGMLLEQNDPLGAAGVFEDLWNTTQQPEALVWAGISRARAGHAAHAVAYLGLAREHELSPPLAALADTVLADARAQTRLLTVELSLRGPGPVSLALTRGEHTAPTLAIPIVPDASVQLVPVLLDPGPWTVELRRGPQTLARTIVVDEQQRTLALREPALPVPPRPRLRPFRLAGLVTGGNMMLLGAAFLGISRPFTVQHSPYSTSLNLYDLASALEWRAAGTGMLGAGLGMTTGALATLAPRPRTRRVLWTIDLVVGGALVGTSFIGGLGGAAFNRGIRTENPYLPPTINLHAAGAAMLGLGLGLATSATLGLILDRADTRRNNRLRAHLTPTGVILHGRF